MTQKDNFYKIDKLRKFYQFNNIQRFDKLASHGRIHGSILCFLKQEDYISNDEFNKLETIYINWVVNDKGKDSSYSNNKILITNLIYKILINKKLITEYL